MNIKKSLLLLLTAILVFSCTQDDLKDQNIDQTADLTTVSQYDNSSMGIYKGTFTTLDAAERGIINLEIFKDQPIRGTLTLVSGRTYNLISDQVFATSQTITNLRLSSEFTKDVVIDFSVEADGSNPVFLNAMLNGSESSILSAKETSRAPVVPVTGTYECVACGTHPTLGTGAQTFNMVYVGDGSGADTMSTEITLNGTTFTSTAAENSQTGCTPSGDFTTCDIAGATTVNPGNVINWIGTHTFNNTATNCSEANGTWAYDSPAYGMLFGNFVGDVICTPQPGDTVATAIPFTPNAEGSGCATADQTVNLSPTGGYTDSGTATGCTNFTQDVFYSWTATTDGITFTANNPSSLTLPLFSVLDATGTTEIDCGDGSFGAITLSGWTIGQDLIFRVAANIEIPFCIEEFSVPGVPANDLCANAEAINCGDTVMGNTVTATNSDASRGNDVWYVITSAGAGEEITASLCGSGYDTWLGIYDACGGGVVASSDDSCGAQSEVTFTSTGAVDYIIKVDGFGAGDSGAFTLAITCVAPPAPTMLGCGDQLVDTGGLAGNYSSNEFETYIIDAGAGLVPTLTFTEFATESCCDFMRIYDGADTTAPEITSVGAATAPYSGTELNGLAVVATGQMMTVVFTSDGSLQDDGYVADVTCASPLIGGSSNQVVRHFSSSELKAQYEEKARNAAAKSLALENAKRELKN